MRRKIVCVVVIALIGCCLTACKKEDKTTQVTPNQGTPSPSPTSTSSPQTSPSASPEATDAKDKVVEVYTIDMDQMVVAPLKTNLKPSEVTPKSIVDAVISNIDEKVGISKIKQDSSKITVVFKSSMAPLKGCEGKMEELILECISNSLLDNISKCQSVVFQTEKGAYDSGHFSFGIDEPYATK